MIPDDSGEIAQIPGLLDPSTYEPTFVQPLREVVVQLKELNELLRSLRIDLQHLKPKP